MGIKNRISGEPTLVLLGTLGTLHCAHTASIRFPFQGLQALNALFILCALRPFIFLIARVIRVQSLAVEKWNIPAWTIARFGSKTAVLPIQK